MNKNRFFLLFSLLLAAMYIFPAPTFACACCAERGHYSLRTAKPTAYEMKELQKLKFDSAELYTDAGYPETVKGISPLGETFSVEGVLSGKSWKFSFADNKRKTGRLDLSQPVALVEYMVDLPGEKPPGEVTLYKEWRFKYRVQNATGIFKPGFAPSTDYFLVLQGYGNVCTSAENFTKWRLEINGGKADYKFFGNLSAKD